MAAQIAAVLASRPPGSVFGSLGTAAELLFAEAALAAGAQLDLVLPVPAAHLRDLVATSGGEQWAVRFDRCVDRAQRVVLASDDPDVGDFGHLAYAVRVAMGLTLLRAQHIDGPALQVLLDEAASDTGAALGEEWTAGGRQRVTLRLGQPADVRGIPVLPPRLTRAVVFGDLPGFSQLREDQLPVFMDQVMRAVGSVIDEGGPHVELRNTWGDAIHLVLDDVRAAARICLGVQDALARVDGRLLAREAPPVMRIGAHYGPVFSGWDAVVHQTTYYGRALTKAARIEPITLPGAVYVSEAFAAILLLETGQEFTCTYVGVVPLAKGFGEFRMYDLAVS
jgi:class 3 adenylate cyclase